MQSDSANNTARVAVRGRHYRCDIIRSLAIRTKVEATRKKKMETRQGVKERKKKCYMEYLGEMLQRKARTKEC